MIPASLQRTFEQKNSCHTTVSEKQGGALPPKRSMVSSTETVVPHIQNVVSHWVISAIKLRAVVNNRNTMSHTTSNEPLSQLTPINHSFVYCEHSQKGWIWHFFSYHSRNLFVWELLVEKGNDYSKSLIQTWKYILFNEKSTQQINPSSFSK